MTTEALLALSKADPKIAAFIERAGTLPVRPGMGDPFTSLAHAIVFQQLAGRAAAAIYGRLVASLGGEMTPQALLARTPDELRAVGLSAAKTAALIDLSTKVADGTRPARRARRAD